MVAIAHDTASGLGGECGTDDVTTGMVLFGLRRSLAYEAVSGELYDDLETVLGEDAVRPDPREGMAIASRLREATTKLVEVAPYLVTPFPTDQMCRVINLSAEQPDPEHAHGHLVRFASSILTLLDLMGEVVS